MTERDQTIILTKIAGAKNWTAVCPDYPEHNASGYSSAEALRQYNAMLWRKHWEKETKLDQCHRRMRDEIRRAAGIPEWAIKFPRFLLWRKKERDAEYSRMSEIVARVCKEHEGQNPGYEVLTDQCIMEFKGIKLHPNHRTLDPDVVEILSR